MKTDLALALLPFLTLAACGKSASELKASSGSSTLPVINFTASGLQVQGNLVAGQDAQLKYAPSRIPCLGYAQGGWSTDTRAFLIVDNQAQSLGRLAYSGFGDVTTTTLTFTVPAGFTQLALYIESSSTNDGEDACHKFDSNNGANYLVPVR